MQESKSYLLLQPLKQKHVKQKKKRKRKSLPVYIVDMKNVKKEILQIKLFM